MWASVDAVDECPPCEPLGDPEIAFVSALATPEIADAAITGRVSSAIRWAIFMLALSFTLLLDSETRNNKSSLGKRGNWTNHRRSQKPPQWKWVKPPVSHARSPCCLHHITA